MKKKEFIFGSLMGFILLLIALFNGINLGKEGKVHIIFCDVGQGDAILIRTPSGKDVLIDGGPDNSVLECLSKYLPFWDREIDMVFLTHPQADHLTGLISVLERYKIDYFLASIVSNNSEGYKKLKSLVDEKGIIVDNPYLGKEIDFNDGVKIKILWPEKEYLLSHVNYTSGIGTYSKVLGMATFRGDLNGISTVSLLTYNNFKVIFTGDADEKVQPEILTLNDLSKIDVLKVPHHGSKTGLNKNFLNTIKPILAIISVGKSNRFGHPTKEILSKLLNLNIIIKRTDEAGDVRIESDGKNWTYN